MADPDRSDPFEALRVGFTAAVSHELRTPLARLLALLDSASLPGADTAALIEQARQEVESLRESAERHGQELVTLFADDAAIAVRPRMVRVVVENLLTNAIRYAGDGARITVSVRREGDVVLISVADNGRGVGSAELSRLFERFYRGDRARTTHGTGLGLAIVKHVVTQAGGDVEARRGPGGLGLEIRCTFPR
jgi:signal transduction histidine kinase